MKKDSKKLLFERMNIIGGMPISVSEHEVDPDKIEDVAQDYQEGDESDSYQVKLDNITMCASKLHDLIQDFDELPSWVQDKITIAEHNMKAIHDWIRTLGHGEDEHDNEVLMDDMNESVIEEENVPTDPSKWSYWKSQAKKKFDVYPCVPEDNSKALTKKGWKGVEELQISDEILAFDPISNSLKYTEILNIHRYENAEIVQFQSNGLNYGYEATPTHKVIMGHDYNWSDNIEEVVTKHKNMTLICENGDAKFNDDDIYEYIYNTKNRIVKPRQIIDLPSSNGFVVVSAKLDEQYENTDLETYVKYKSNPIEMVLNMSYDQLKSFLYGSIMCDGWQGVDSDTCVSYGFRQKNTDNYEAVALAGFLTGHFVSKAKELNDNDCRDMRIRTRSHIDLSRMNVTELNTNKNVWCPETRYGTWVMCQGDTITITGNSAYANGWAAKKYKAAGGGWKKKKKK